MNKILLTVNLMLYKFIEDILNKRKEINDTINFLDSEIIDFVTPSLWDEIFNTKLMEMEEKLKKEKIF